MDFETRLESLHTSPAVTPAAEIDAAANVYERLVTAQSICESVFGKEASPSVVAAVMAELSTEARRIFERDERLFGEAGAE